jgi:hypothetical protein
VPGKGHGAVFTRADKQDGRLTVNIRSTCMEQDEVLQGRQQDGHLTVNRRSTYGQKTVNIWSKDGQHMVNRRSIYAPHLPVPDHHTRPAKTKPPCVVFHQAHSPLKPTHFQGGAGVGRGRGVSQQAPSLPAPPAAPRMAGQCLPGRPRSNPHWLPGGGDAA